MTDRELDALVAEKVMGRPWRKPTHGRCCTCQDCGHDINDCECGYSEDISAAWSVVERMRELGWHIDLDNDGSHKIGAEESWTWNALLWTDRDDYDGDGDGDWPTAHADTAPRAICLAALRAVGVEVES